MTLRERTNLIEHKIQMLKACNWECEVCGNPLTLDGCQLAHRLPSTKYNLKTYGKAVIHHPKNLACVCSLMCNSAVLLNRATHPVEANELIDEIRDDLLCS